MQIIVLDFETFFSADYTLSKETTESYVRDPRFEVHGCGIRRDGPHDCTWHPADRLVEVFAGIDWANTAVLGHHMHFDGLILAHHYGIYPKLYLDTYSMARALLGTHIGKGLESLAAHFGLGAKTLPYDLFKGKHWHELAPFVKQQIAKGCCDDVSLTWELFCKLAPSFPQDEYTLVDATVRMFTKPVLVGDTDLLGKIWQEEETKKSALLAQLGLTVEDIRKDWAFAKALREQGIEPPQKRMKDGKCKKCKGTGKVSDGDSLDIDCAECEGTGVEERYKYAFAKTDDFMRELEDHGDEDVRLLHEAKIAAHGTGTQTRTFRLGWMSTRGAMCVYLNYCGTHLKGWSGGDKVNWQNLKRGGPIAAAIRAPHGCAVVVSDASQVECRLLNEVAGQVDVIDRFRNHQDPYVALASTFYGEEIYKPKNGDPRYSEMEQKRGTGKQGELSCLGPDTLILTDHGTKPITDVTLEDRLWDGEEWVTHRGLLNQGIHTVIDVAGLRVTKGHGVLCGMTWKFAESLLDVHTLFHALATTSETLLSRDMKSAIEGVCLALSSGVQIAGLQNIGSIIGTSNLGALRDVINVLKKPRGNGSKNGTVMPTFALIKTIGVDCYLVLLPLSPVAPVRILTTAGAVYECTLHGAKELLVDESFSRILLPWRAGIIQFWTLIEKIRTRDTCPEISALSRTLQTAPTDVPSQSFNRKSTVYDLAFAGPRNRFAVVSTAGPLTVHNCGYGAGGPTIKATAKKGTYGPPVYLTDDDALRLRDTYRSTHPHVVSLWKEAGDVLKKLHAGMEFEWGPVYIQDKRMWMPGDLPIIYETLKWEDDPDDGYDPGWRVRVNKNGWSKMYGAKFVENLIQGLRNALVRQAWLRCIRAGLDMCSMEHDKLIAVVGVNDAEAAYALIRQELSRPPSWLPAIPLDSEGYISDTLAKPEK